MAPDPWLDAAFRRLIADLGWSGLFNLQFIVHGGAPLRFDLNPRAYHTLALAVAAGVNPALWVERLLDARITALREARPGVRFRAEIDDGLAVLRLAKRGDLRAALRAARPHRGTVHALAAPGDRRPALLTIAASPLKRIRARLTTG